MEEGSTERAFAYLKAKKSNDAPSLSSLFQLGREAHELKKYALSSEIYRYLLRQKAALRGYGLLGEVLLRTGENDLALGNDLEPLFEQYPLGGCEECFSWELWQVRQRLMRESAAARAGNETALDSLERRTDQLMKRYPYEFERGQCYHLRADGLLLFGYFDDALLDYARAETLLGDHELGDQSKFKRALCAFYSGDIPWSLTQLEVLMRSTSKTIANDAAEYALLIAANSFHPHCQLLPGQPTGFFFRKQCAVRHFLSRRYVEPHSACFEIPYVHLLDRPVPTINSKLVCLACLTLDKFHSS